MSISLKTLQNTGSRNVEMHVTQYYGGEKNGTCLQLTALQEDGIYGYIQLNKNDIKLINELWSKANETCDLEKIGDKDA